MLVPFTLCLPLLLAGTPDELPGWLSGELRERRIRCTSERGFVSLLGDGSPDLRLLQRGGQPILTVEKTGHLLSLGKVGDSAPAPDLPSLCESLPASERDPLLLAGLDSPSPSRCRRSVRAGSGQRLLARIADPFTGRGGVIAIIDLIEVELSEDRRPTLRGRAFVVEAPDLAAPRVPESGDLARRKGFQRLYSRSTYGLPHRARFDPMLATSDVVRGGGVSPELGLFFATPTRLEFPHGLRGGLITGFRRGAELPGPDSTDWLRSLDVAEGEHLLLWAESPSYGRLLKIHVARVEEGELDFSWNEWTPDDPAEREFASVKVEGPDRTPAVGAWVTAGNGDWPPDASWITQTDDRGLARVRREPSGSGRISCWTVDDRPLFGQAELTAGTIMVQLAHSDPVSLTWEVPYTVSGSLTIRGASVRHILEPGAALTLAQAAAPLRFVPDRGLRSEPSALSWKTSEASQQVLDDSARWRRVWCVDALTGAALRSGPRVDLEEPVGIAVQVREGQVLLPAECHDQEVHATVHVEGYRPASLTVPPSAPAHLDLPMYPVR